MNKHYMISWQVMNEAKARARRTRLNRTLLIAATYVATIMMTALIL